MTKKIVVFDTSVILCWLRVPGKDTCGPEDDRWDYTRINNLIAGMGNAIFVLPLATLIETGNHIAQCGGDRYVLAQNFSEQIIKPCADATAPWAAFTEQSELWSSTALSNLAEEWPILASQHLSLGDATIKNVAKQYATAGMSVEILTGDAGLKSYEPIQPAIPPRRRR